MNLKTDAKICAALQRAHAVATAQRHIPPTSFTKFHAANAGGEAPGRIMALANVFLRTVDIAEPALTEAQYDAMPSAWLERASSALNAAEKSHGADYLATTDGKAIVACLTEPGDAGKKLAALKPKKPADATASSQPVELTIERAMDEVTAWQNRPLETLYSPRCLRCPAGDDLRPVPGAEQGRASGAEYPGRRSERVL